MKSGFQDLLNGGASECDGAWSFPGGEQDRVLEDRQITFHDREAYGLDDFAWRKDICVVGSNLQPILRILQEHVLARPLKVTLPLTRTRNSSDWLR